MIGVLLEWKNGALRGTAILEVAPSKTPDGYREVLVSAWHLLVPEDSAISSDELVTLLKTLGPANRWPRLALLHRGDETTDWRLLPGAWTYQSRELTAELLLPWNGAPLAPLYPRPELTPPLPLALEIAFGLDASALASMQQKEAGGRGLAEYFNLDPRAALAQVLGPTYIFGLVESEERGLAHPSGFLIAKVRSEALARGALRLVERSLAELWKVEFREDPGSAGAIRSVELPLFPHASPCWMVEKGFTALGYDLPLCRRLHKLNLEFVLDKGSHLPSTPSIEATFNGSAIDRSNEMLRAMTGAGVGRTQPFPYELVVLSLSQREGGMLLHCVAREVEPQR
ncbi:MAG: hypothetical protein A2284_13200 [Deltaproteobacteria bacterium RIFOXYA12_FULL_61_11]|nr:MAG: hypothetical protein A2284_13200 [Deltaproteobacteria bacterium RIFOXYA12_FULL_61_11]